MTSARHVISLHDAPRLAPVNAVLLALGGVALTVRLWPDWRSDPNLSHGFFMPIVFALLIYEARQGTPRFLPNSIGTRVAFTALLVLSLLALFASGLYAAAVDWSHPLVNLSLTAAFVFLVGAGLIVLASDRIRYLRFNWSAVAAAVLWLLCTPIPPGTYSRLTLTLQLWVSECVLRTLHILGIAAIRHGNIIELGQATVGVEEACSGIRSLISCVFAGLFFSATLVKRPSARVLVVVLAAPLALAMNFLRSLTLTLLVNRGVDITGTWHDATGFAVLGVTAIILAVLAIVLERGNRAEPAPPPVNEANRTPRRQLAALAGTIGVAATLIFVSIANTRPSIHANSAPPDLDALIPARVAGWDVSTSSDLFQFRDTLQTDHLFQRTYRRLGPNGTITEVILYVAYWHAGQAPVSLVASHTPDACWPGSGWTNQAVAAPRVHLDVDHRVLPEAEYRLFTLGNFPQHVWFWHLYDGRPIAFRDPYSAIALLRIAWEYGFRHNGDQLFVRVSSNRPWAELEHDPLMETFFERTERLGL